MLGLRLLLFGAIAHGAYHAHTLALLVAGDVAVGAY